jgi:hypothetical protein
MNYNINIDEVINNEKIVIQKKNYYCLNCNRKGHTFKNCNEPIISNGIIAIYIKNINLELIPYLENYIVKNLKIFNNPNNKKNINFIKKVPITNTNSNTDSNSDSNSNSDLESNSSLNKWFEKSEKMKPETINTTNINDNIQFLMVQRKHSLGYLEFMRGRYSIEHKDKLIYLIQQMSPNEISDISTKDFDYLWNTLWDLNNIKNKNHQKEYIQSKQKFYQIKIIFPNIFEDTKPLYDFNEWGFPKGRRESYESDLVCAIREFEEETNLNESNYTIFEKCKSIRENLIGTNGVNYTHNYFLSIINDNSDSNDESNLEIGQTKVLNIVECLNRIRPYHKNKIRIIKHIYMVINDFLQEYSQFE